MLDLTRITWSATRYEGIFLHFLRRDEATGDTTVLIRMQPGCSYPTHRHKGIEEVFILQGGYKDSRGEHRAGDYHINEAGSAHRPIALTDPAEDCIMLAIAHSGIEILKAVTSDE
jgi:anti-sigma factor ChrR (cupin superfamily)